jgi:transposase
VAGDNPERVRSEAAWARLCGVAPVPASSGKTVRMRLARGGHRQANAALYRSVIVRMRFQRMRFHQPTIAYVARRTAEGKAKPEIIRCLKRYLAREVWAHLHPDRHPANPTPPAVDEL